MHEVNLILYLAIYSIFIRNFIIFWFLAVVELFAPSHIIIIIFIIIIILHMQHLYNRCITSAE